MINTRLTPSQHTQHNENHRRNAQSPFLPQARQTTQAISNCADDHGHDPNACQILKTVGDKSILHIAVIDKAQHRRQRNCKKQRPGQRSAPKPLPKVPESYHQYNGGDEIPPSQWIGGANVPKRIDDS